MTFAAMMRQECGWFDDEDHSVGALSARLTGDAANLQSVCYWLNWFLEFPFILFSLSQAIGFPLSIIIQSLSTFIIGICISFAFSIKLSLVCLTAVPLSLLTVILEAK